MRARFSTSALVGLGVLATGALGIAATLATTDKAKWPAWLRPYYAWGWWAVFALLLAAAALSAWQYTRQNSNSPANQQTRVQGNDSGPVAGQDVTITGEGPTAGRDLQTVTGGSGPTAGGDVQSVTGGAGQTAARDVNVTSVTIPTSSHVAAGLVMRSIVTTAPNGTRTVTTEIFSEEVALQRIQQDSLEVDSSPEVDSE